MKKPIFLLTTIFLVSFLVSCEKKEMDEFKLKSIKDKKTVLVSDIEKLPSTPISDLGVTPYIITGANPGGNRTCAEVAEAFQASFDFCGNKIDYDDDGFASGFPSGLSVFVDHNFISFEMDDCIMIEGKYYKVGAVIVKGSNHANVYYYENGVLSDAGLAAPEALNMVSNLTFCFVECEVIALKCYYWNGTYYGGAVSSGTALFTDGWCGDWLLGVNDFPFTSPINIHNPYTNTTIGVITFENDVVTVTLNEGLILDWSNLFVGTLSDYLDNLALDGCPAYSSAPWIRNAIDGNSQTFPIK